MYTSDTDRVNKVEDKKVIWCNHWFTAITNTIKDVKKTFGNSIVVIASNKNDRCAYKNYADKFFVEDGSLSAEEYVEWALGVCADNKVDLFIPKRCMLEIAKNMPRFEAIGTKVMCDDATTISLFDSKSEVYTGLAKSGYTSIPWFKVVKSIDDFILGYREVVESGNVVCIKYDTDEGASSFRVISDNWMNIDSLKQPLMNLITYNDMLSILSDGLHKNRLKPMILMHKLNNPEVSVDCYNSSQFGFVALPRFKMGNRVKEIRLNNSIIFDAKKLQDIYGFKSVWNAQYRWQKDGSLKLLEINPRISGGIHLSSAIGFSLPIQCIAEKLGIESNNPMPNKLHDHVVTQCETPIVLE